MWYQNTILSFIDEKVQFNFLDITTCTLAGLVLPEAERYKRLTEIHLAA